MQRGRGVGAAVGSGGLAGVGFEVFAKSVLFGEAEVVGYFLDLQVCLHEQVFGPADGEQVYPLHRALPGVLLDYGGEVAWREGGFGRVVGHGEPLVLMAGERLQKADKDLFSARRLVGGRPMGGGYLVEGLEDYLQLHEGCEAAVHLAEDVGWGVQCLPVGYAPGGAEDMGTGVVGELCAGCRLDDGGHYL